MNVIMWYSHFTFSIIYKIYSSIIVDLCIISGNCHNGGTCITTRHSSYCICAEGFLGKNCKYRGMLGSRWNGKVLKYFCRRNVRLASDANRKF